MNTSERKSQTKQLSANEQDSVRAYIRDTMLQNYTQREAGEVLGISSSSISRIVNGEQVVTPALVIAVSKASGLSVPEVLGQSDGRRAPTLGQFPGYLESERSLRDSQAVNEDASFWLCVRDVTIPIGHEIAGVTPEDVFACVQLLRGLRRRSK